MASPLRGADRASGRPWRDKKTARPQHLEGEGGGEGGESHRGGRGRWQRSTHTRRSPRVLPNFFVGVRVRSEQVVNHVERLQEVIRAELPEIAPCLIDPRTLHVTLCVVHLPDDKAIEDASEVLRSETLKFLEQRVEQSDEPLALKFSNWGFFGRNDVLFASTESDARSVEWLSTLAEALHSAFDRLGFTTERFPHPYTPHLTVWKTSKDRNLIKALNASRPPDATVQDDLARLVLAHELPSSVDFPTRIDLLSMRERDQDGYYMVYASESMSLS